MDSMNVNKIKKAKVEENKTYCNHNTVAEYFRRQKNPKDVIKESTAKKHSSDLKTIK